MRIELTGGDWADLRDRLLYGQAREVRLAMVAIEADKAAMADVDIVLVRAYVADWHVHDLAGELVPLDTPEAAPDDVIQAIALAGMELWKGKPAIPKAGKKTLPSTPRALRSA